MQLKQGAIQIFALYFYSLRLCIKVLEILLWRVEPSQQPNIHPAACLLPSLTRQGKKWTKARGLVNLDNNRLIGKAKAVVISQAKYGISSLLHQQADVQPIPGKQSLSTCNACLGRWTPSPQLSFFPPPCPELFFLRVVSHGVEYFLVTFSLLCWSAVLSTLSIFPVPQPTPFWMCVGRVETLMLCKHSSALAKTLGCY